MKVIGDLARLSARRTPGKAALILGDDVLSYAMLDRRSNRAAAGLETIGVGKGDRVAIVARTILDYAVVTQAVAKRGAIIVPVNPRYTAREIGQVLSDAASAAVFVEPALAAECRKAVAALDRRPLLVAIAGEAVPGCDRCLGDLEAGDGAAAPRTEVSPDDPATIMYTSGTTGRPKGVLYAHGAHFGLMEAQIVELDFDHDDVVHIASPLFTNGGLNGGINCTLWIGATGILHGGSFDPAALLAMFERHRVTIAFWVPTMISMILSNPAVGRCDHSSLRKVYYGSMPIGGALLARARKTFAGARFYQIYGSTECGFVAVLRPEDHARFADATGREAFNCESRIIDEAGREVGPGGIGEIVVRQNSSGMIGYWRNPAATAATIRDGWIHSGDLARVEADGFFTLVGRKRDLIISGAENIYPKEIELVLETHPAVREAAVFGIPDEKYGETVCAAIALRPGAKATASDIEAHCLAHLARYKRPRVIEFHDELPKNAMGKVTKEALRTRHWQGRARTI